MMRCEETECSEPVHRERFCIDHHVDECSTLKSWNMKEMGEMCDCWCKGKPDVHTRQKDEPCHVCDAKKGERHGAYCSVGG